MDCIALVARAIVDDADSRSDAKVACLAARTAEVMEVVAAGADHAAGRSRLLTDCANSVCHVYEPVRVFVLLPDNQSEAEPRYDDEEDEDEDRT